MVIFTEMNRNHSYILINEETNYLLNKYKNFILNHYYHYEYKKFKDYYIIHNYEIILYYIEYYNYSGERHREDGPACIKYYENGKISRKEYYLNDKGHREDGPAFIYYDENGKIYIKEYHLNNEQYSYTDYLEELKCIQQ